MNEFWDHFLAIFLDPAHFAAEVTFTLLIDGLILGLIWPLIRRAIKREHIIIDREHGKPHYGDPIDWNLVGYTPSQFPDPTDPADGRVPSFQRVVDIDFGDDEPVPYVLTDKGENRG